MVTSELHLLHKISNGVQRIGGQEASQKWHRERVARMKNAKGKWKISYALGGLAKNLRATYSCGSAAGWAKGEALHMVQRTGSRIACLSPTTQTLETPSSKRRFDRSIVTYGTMARETPTTAHRYTHDAKPAAHAGSGADFNTCLPSDNIIAIKDEPDPNTHWLARATRVKGDSLPMDYFGRTDKSCERLDSDLST
jgi:hypothetical protein